MQERSGSDRTGALSRQADSPAQITLRGWWRVARRVVALNARERLGVLAAGIAYFVMLSVFPALTAFISLYGLIADPATVQEHAAVLRNLVPEAAYALLEEHMRRVAQTGTPGLSLGSLFGLLLALWSAGAGLRATMQALNATYREEETRSLFRFYGTAILFTLGAVAVGLLSLGVIIGLPIVLQMLQLGEIGSLAVAVLPWLVLLVVVLFAVGALYRFGPSRAAARPRWISVGAVVATLSWLLISLGFTLYVSLFGTYNETYGTLGAAIALLIWFWLTAYILLFGAALNAELEHETARDTTTGPPEPMGRRGAWVADHAATDGGR